jgi:membrane-associated phospholipid phosphatase
MRFRHAAIAAMVLTLPVSRALFAQYQNPNLHPDDARDLARITATSIARANDLRTVGSKAFNESTAIMEEMSAGPTAASQYMLWHEVSLVVTALDHSPTSALSPGSYHEQYGPPRTSRALALVHLAMFEAANPWGKTHYSGLLSNLNSPAAAPQDAETVETAAIVEAAYGTLSWLYPGLTTAPLDLESADDLAGQGICSAERKFSLRRIYRCSIAKLGGERKPDAVTSGIEFGRRIVGEIIRTRGNDGSQSPDPTWGVDFIPAGIPHGDGTYSWVQWQQDPVSGLNLALGARWNQVKPFALDSAAQFRLQDNESAVIRWGLTQKKPEQWPSYSTVEQIGGDHRLNSPRGASAPINPKYPDLYYIAKFWAYDATAGLCAPIREYNQIADAILPKLNLTDVTDIARYYSLLNIAMADAAIAAWDSKYYFQVARPVTAIRYQESQDPTATKYPELWFPLGAQVTNSTQPYNITPPFPAYPSGHATFGGAFFGVLRAFLRDKDQEFRFQSDEFNGVNKDVYNFIRCKDGDNQDSDFCHYWGSQYVKDANEWGRKFNLDCAERENADSRIWMGVHWMFDADDGIEIGNKVAWKVFNSVLKAPGQAPADPSVFVERSSGHGGKPGPLSASERDKLVCPALPHHKEIFDDLDHSYKSAQAAETGGSAAR